MSQPWYPLCSALPSGEMLYLAGVLRGQALDLHDAVWAATNVIAFAETQLLRQPTTASAGQVVSDEVLAGHLEMVAKSGAGVGAGVIPWALIVQTLGPLLLQWLLKQTGG